MKIDSDLMKLYYENLMRINEENKRKEEIKRKKVSLWKNQGYTLVYPDQIGAWDVYVDNRARDVFNGQDIEDALAVMQALEDGVQIKDAIKIFASSENSKAYDKIIAQTVGYFSKQGVKFLKSIYTEVFKEKLDEPFLNFLKQIDLKNQTSLQLLQNVNE